MERRVELACEATPVDSKTLVMRETSAGRIHLKNFGVRFAGQAGRDRFSVRVELRDGTVFGPLKGVSALDLLTRLNVNGVHFRGDGYYSSDYFFIEGGKLQGRTRLAQGLAPLLNALRRAE